jgi:hypothetical protein
MQSEDYGRTPSRRDEMNHYRSGIQHLVGFSGSCKRRISPQWKDLNKIGDSRSCLAYTEQKLKKYCEDANLA